MTQNTKTFGNYYYYKFTNHYNAHGF